MTLAGRGATRPCTLAPDDGDDAFWIAQQMVLDAGAQAARLRRQASAQAATLREAAEREAEIVWQQASLQAAAVREAAEREAAQLLATVVRLSAGPGDLAEPEAGPVATAATQARRQQGPPRQLVALRVAAAATAALSLFAVTAGTAEIVLHGFAFFVFRSAGTGETSPNGLQEDQGPGQPDAPKPTPSHINADRDTAKSAQRGHREQRLTARGGG